jgi:hypothetical protein
MTAAMAAEVAECEERSGRSVAAIFDPVSCAGTASADPRDGPGTAQASTRGHSAASLSALACASNFSVTAESLPSSPVATS